MTHAATGPRPPLASSAPTTHESAMPYGVLMLLALSCFLTLLSETLPAGMLVQMSAGLGVSESAAGQSVTAFALGCVLAAIPLTVVTRRLTRRRVTLAVVGTAAVTSLLTAVLPTLLPALLVRFVAGLAAGLTWASIPSYARTLAPPGQAGRAISITAIGGTSALAIGVPLGSAVAERVGWRLAFAGLAAAAAALCVVLALALPADTEAQRSTTTATLRSTLRDGSRRAVRPILVVVVLAMLGHATLYTYVAPYVATVEDASLSLTLAVFGIGSLAGAVLSGWLVDRHLHALLLASVGGIAVAGAMLLAGPSPGVLAVTALGWGLAFGSAAPAVQTAAARIAGTHADASQAVLVTVWNLMFAAGGVLGGAVLAARGAAAVPVPTMALAAAATAVVAVTAGRALADR